MEIERKRFKKLFPHLADEMEKGTGHTVLDDLADMSDGIGPNDRETRSHEPNVRDFLRRCRNLREAIEVISYMEKQGELTPVHAKALRQMVEKKGIGAFRHAADLDILESKGLEKP